MKTRREWAVAIVATAMLGAEPVQAQDRSCNEGRGGLMTDLGFDRPHRSMQVDPQNGRMEMAFVVEPQITGVRHNSPAAGRLRDGDVLLAVDGQPIITPEGADRYSRIEPGEQVRLSIRRDGRMQDVTVTAVARCIPHPPAPPEPPAPPAPPAPPLPPMDEIMPEGWFGFGISCNNCGIGDSNGVFRFREPPVLVNVAPNSPAARAGTRPGDRLTHVDGVPLTSGAGWPRWYAIQPGQEVRLTYTRGAQTHHVRISALHQP